MTDEDREAAEAEHDDQEACIAEQQREIDRLRAALVNSDAEMQTLRAQYETEVTQRYRLSAIVQRTNARIAELEQKARDSWAAYVGADAMLKASEERDRIIQDHRERALEREQHWKEHAAAHEERAERWKQAEEKAWEQATEQQKVRVSRLLEEAGFFNAARLVLAMTSVEAPNPAPPTYEPPCPKCGSTDRHHGVPIDSIQCSVRIVEDVEGGSVKKGDRCPTTK